jgi:hypothetical protein
MPGLVPGIHVFLALKTWMAGTGPAMTNLNVSSCLVQCDLARQNATTCSSAVFIGDAGNSASASTAIAP